MLAIFPITEVVQERKATFKEDAKEDGPKMFFISTRVRVDQCEDIFM